MSEAEAAASTGGGNTLLTAAVVAPVAFAVVVPFWYSFVMDDLQKDAVMALLIAHGLPAECLGKGLPTSSCVNQSFPVLIISIISLMILYMVKIFFIDKPSQAVLDVIEAEFDKRHDVLKGLLQELEDGFNRDKDDEDIELFNSQVVWEKVREVLELPGFSKKVAEEGIRWLWIVLEKDFRVTIKLTKEGEDVSFSDGVKLDRLLNSFDRVISMAYMKGYAPEGETKKELYKYKWEAIYYLRVHELKTVTKAFKIAMMAKAAFPFLVLQTIGTTFTAALGPLQLHYRAQVLENLRDTEGTAFWDSAKAMIFVELLSTILNLVTSMLRVQAETLAQKDIQIAYYDALLKMPVAFWARQASLEYGSQVNFWTLYMFGSEITGFLKIPQTILQDLVTAVSYAYLILQSSSRSLFLLLGVNFGSNIISWVLGKINVRLRAMCLSGIIQEAANDWMSLDASLDPEYISLYLSFVRGPLECKRFEKMKTSEAEYERRTNLVQVLTGPVSAVLAQGSQVAQFATARTNVIQDGMGIADADTMVRSANSFVEQTQSITGIFGEIMEYAKPLAKAYDIISLPRTIDPDTGLWPKEKSKGHIEFKDVHFKYPRRDAKVLKGVTFTVQPGDTIGMTGNAGCGKSTCMRLLERFYDVSAGSILLDGIDIREYNPRWLRGQVATVAQEPKLVPLTLRENLTFGCAKEPPLEKIYDALKAANIYESIMDKEKFPQGLRTQIEACGNVSGGEKQRIAIARAILADPPILLLDEATSALDEENQAKVQDALDKLMKGRTTMVIAHRLSTIKDSSKIVAFDKGKVFEEGSHDDLMKTEGSLYRGLWERQLSKRGGVDEEETEEEEVEEVEPLPVEAGMNPKPTALKKLETLVQTGSDLSITEAQQILKMLKSEEASREVRSRGITRSAITKWKQQMVRKDEDAPVSNKKFKSLANKVMFRKLHSNVSEKLASMKKDE